MKKDIYAGSGVSTLEGIQNVLGILVALDIIVSAICVCVVAKSHHSIHLEYFSFLWYITFPSILLLVFTIRIIQPFITITKAAQCIVLEKELALQTPDAAE